MTGEHPTHYASHIPHLGVSWDDGITGHVGSRGQAAIEGCVRASRVWHESRRKASTRCKRALAAKHQQAARIGLCTRIQAEHQCDLTAEFSVLRSRPDVT